MPDAKREVSLHEAAAWCGEVTATSDASGTQLMSVSKRAVAFFDASGISRMADVSPVAAAAFVGSRLESGLPASLPTQHNRRVVLRFLFRVARRHGYLGADPTADLMLPPRSPLSTRPLVDSEIDICRDVAWWTSSRAAAAWALAEATARGAEIALVRPDDVDLEGRAVQLRGGARTEPRTGSLTAWGADALRRRSGETGGAYFAYAGAGRGIAGQVSTCRAISSVLLRAGLAGEPDVRPASVSAWSGRRAYDEAGRIEDAARVMGVRSLDRAARLIGVSWTGD